jgi:hypothetical protein
MQRTISTVLILGAALGLGACGSTRFGGSGPQVASARPGPAYNAPEPGPIEPAPAIPSGPVTSAPLAPPPGVSGPVTSIEPAPAPMGGRVAADVPAMPSSPAPVAPPQQQVASASPSRSNVVGGWNAREASGSSCRVQLSSSPALDLYKASASGCGNRDLARVTAWDFREGEVFLYQPGGAIAARLRPAGSSLDGVLAKSGAPLTLNR